MMRVNSHDSAMGSESTPETVTQVATTPSQDISTPMLSAQLAKALTPPNAGMFPVDRLEPEHVDVTPRPNNTKQRALDEDMTPRPPK